MEDENARLSAAGALNILKHLGYVVDGKATPNRS